MPLLVLLLLGFLIVLPIAELAVMIGVAIWIGVLPMLGLLVLSAAVGLLIVRYRTGTHWIQFREAVENLRLPTTQAFNGVAVPIGGALLVIPGFITSLMGIFLLVPPTRFFARKTTFRLITSQFFPLRLLNRLPDRVKKPISWVMKNNLLVRWLGGLMAWGNEEWRQRQSESTEGTIPGTDDAGQLEVSEVPVEPTRSDPGSHAASIPIPNGDTQDPTQRTGTERPD